MNYCYIDMFNIAATAFTQLLKRGYKDPCVCYDALERYRQTCQRYMDNDLYEWDIQKDFNFYPDHLINYKNHTRFDLGTLSLRMISEVKGNIFTLITTHLGQEILRLQPNLSNSLKMYYLERLWPRNIVATDIMLNRVKI